MLVRVVSALLLMGACFTVRAHDVITTKVTWSREISRLVYRRCASCHRAGGSSFSLMNYQDARPWAKAIKEETLERRMPPWGAVKGFGSFRDDQGLTQEDLELISDWVEGGAPDGDRAVLPKPPDFRARTAVRSETHGKVVNGGLDLERPLVLTGIRPTTVMDGKTVQVVAELPGGSIEPLLWLYNYKPQFDHAYFYRTPISLPAGTKIRCFPENAGALSLLTSP